MRSDLRVVFDTNTLISAFLLPKSIPRQALDAATAAGRFLLSAATATEVTEVLRQPKFDRYLGEHRRLTLLAVVITTPTSWKSMSPSPTAVTPRTTNFSSWL